MNTLNNELRAKSIIQINMRVPALRKRMGLTQVEFAKRAGVGLRFLRELEQGKTSVRLDKLLQVLDFLGCHLEIKGNNAEINKWLAKSGIKDES